MSAVQISAVRYRVERASAPGVTGRWYICMQRCTIVGMPDQKLILELSRLALAGDSEAARQFLGKVLRRALPENDPGMPLRESLAKLLVGATAASRAEQHARDAVATSGVGMQLAPPEFAMLTRVERFAHAPSPILSSESQQVLDAIVAERHSADMLRREGIEPTRSVILTGAPGVGKTMTARYLAAVLNLPLVTVDLAAIMSSYLGQTGQNLRRALDVARASSCVFFIDEIDALAKRRDDDADVGELKRIVNILLLELERWPSHSVLIAATNHPELLDRAVWRRFDRVVRLTRPQFETRQRILAHVLAEHGREVEPESLASCAAATEGLAGSDLARIAREAIRESLLAGDNQIGERMVHQAMQELVRRSRHDERARIAFCDLAARELRLSQREIAKRIGISHVQVGRLIKQTIKLRENGQVATA